MAIDLLLLFLPPRCTTFNPIAFHISPYLSVLDERPHRSLCHINEETKKEDEFPGDKKNPGTRPSSTSKHTYPNAPHTLRCPDVNTPTPQTT
jgi:hypothetical protein